MIYLCSPYSHADESVRKRRFETAAKAAGKIMRYGIPVIAPLSNTVPSVQQGIELTHEECLNLDIQLLMRCDEMVVLALPGWDKSVGVWKEITEALIARKPITIIAEEDVCALPYVNRNAIRYLEPELLPLMGC